MKPIYKEGFLPCPACKSLDTVSLVDISACVVTWCCCGRVFVNHIDEDEDKHDIIYSFAL